VFADTPSSSQDVFVILYKYVPPERLDVLAGGLIAYPPPWIFNDPFESTPVYPADDPDAIELAKLKTGDDANDLPIQNEIDRLQSAHGIRRITIEQAASGVGVLSLSETRDSVLMWGHYTSQYTGFVIGFDVDHPAWRRLQMESGPTAEPSKILYSRTRAWPDRMIRVTPDVVWYTKSSEWEYEREWRFTRLIRKAAKTVRVGDDDIPLFPFPKEAVREVILGHRVSAGLDLEIHQLLLETGFEGLKIFRAIPDKKCFQLNITAD
jgi:Protein of unknown function (DUF2971)